MRRRHWALVIALALLAPAAAHAQGMGLGAGVPDTAMVYPRGGATSPGVDYIFSVGSYYQKGVSVCVSAATCLTVTRTTTNGSATDLLPTAPSGQTITIFADNTARVSSVAGGLIVEEARVNQLLNATAPVTQTTASINCASPGCTLWVNGTGSATASAGTATGCSGFAAATNGAPNTFICTGAGTITVTVTGALKAFQLEIGGFGTSLISSTAAAGSRGSEVVVLTTFPTIGAQYSMAFFATPESPVTNTNNQFGLSIEDGTGNNRAQLLRTNTSNTMVAATFSGGSGVFIASAGAWAQNVLGKAAMTVAAGAQNATFNGVVAGTSAGALPITPIDIAIGGYASGTSPWNGTVSRISVWPTVALTTAQLQALTK